MKKSIRSQQETLCNQLLHGTGDSIQLLQNNQTVIEKETEAIKHQMSVFQTQTNNWLSLYHDLNEEMKKIGDVVNWASIIEQTLRA